MTPTLETLNEILFLPKHYKFDSHFKGLHGTASNIILQVKFVEQALVSFRKAELTLLRGLCAK